MGALKIFDGVKWVSIGGGERGERGPQGNGIDHATLNPDYTLTLFWTNGTSSTYGPIRGEQGEQGETGDDGNGIASVTWIGGTHAAGTEDTYRITFTDGTHFDFGVYNGNDGQGSAGSQVPLPDGGNGSVGTAIAYAREDHVHPSVLDEIWENQSPTSSFASQFLAYDLTKYTGVYIMFQYNSSSNGHSTMWIPKTGAAVQCFMRTTTSTTTNLRASYCNDTGIQISGGYSGTSSSNAACIPIFIYGVR